MLTSAEVPLLFAVLGMALAAVGGLYTNRPKIAAAVKFAAAVVPILQRCGEATADGTATAEEERTIGRATIAAYRQGGETLAALVER